MPWRLIVATVWLTVDSTLYLWCYEGSSSSSGENDFCSFDGTADGQCIVSVGLVRPKKGEFVVID